MNTPVSQTPEFQAKWAALEIQLGLIRHTASLTHPNPTHIAEFASVARYYLNSIEALMIQNTQPGKDTQS